MGLQPVRTAFRSPWQNGIAERWVGSVRRGLLGHVIVLNRRHLRRLLKEYLRYYHEDRTHLALGKDSPLGRVPTSVPSDHAKVSALPRLGGLRHRYRSATWEALTVLARYNFIHRLAVPCVWSAPCQQAAKRLQRCRTARTVTRVS
jgi:hypothetical protein